MEDLVQKGTEVTKRRRGMDLGFAILDFGLSVVSGCGQWSVFKARWMNVPKRIRLEGRPRVRSGRTVTDGSRFRAI